MDVSVDTCGHARLRSLLLLLFCVFEAAADCLKPQGGENSVLSNDALLINDFPEGTIVTLECANGYRPQDGSGEMTCLDDNWTKPTLNCIKKDCGLPKDQPHMKFNLSQGTLFGALAEVYCEKGYQISGSSFKQCFNRGWMGSSGCEIVICERPAKVTNGMHSWLSSEDYPEYQQEIQYSCEEGYTLIGNSRIICTEDGEYDSKPPECIGFRFMAGTKEEETTSEPAATPTSTQVIIVLVCVLCSVIILAVIVVVVYCFLRGKKGAANVSAPI